MTEPAARIETRDGTVADLVAAAEVLGDAFADYPWTRWTVDPENHRARIASLQYLALRRFCLPFGGVSVTTVDEEIRSVAAWADSARFAPDLVDDSVKVAIADLEGSRHETSVAAELQLADWRPESRHFFLGTVGTAPDVQGQGLGRRTLAPLLEVADRETVQIFLETSTVTNVTLYSSLAFTVIEQRRIDGGGPPVWAMLRPPNS